jgi:hypothetical protein
LSCSLSIVICVCMLCCSCNWPSGCWLGILINQNWIELNWIIIINKKAQGFTIGFYFRFQVARITKSLYSLWRSCRSSIPLWTTPMDPI